MKDTAILNTRKNTLQVSPFASNLLEEQKPLYLINWRSCVEILFSLSFFMIMMMILMMIIIMILLLLLLLLLLLMVITITIIIM